MSEEKKSSDLLDELFQEEVISLLKDILRKTKKKISVNSPDVNVNIPDVIVPKQEAPIVNLDLKSLQASVERLRQELKPKSKVIVSNIDKAFKSEISVKNLKEIERLLKDLNKKEVVVKVNPQIKETKISFPSLPKPDQYIPVRLTNGKRFYEALQNAIASAGLSDEAETNLKNLSFDANNNLKVSIVGDVTITGDVIVDDVGLENVAGSKINPATEEKQDDIIAEQATETTLAKLTDVLYATEYGATYNYIMKYKRGTTTWEIQRETISTGVREYATGTTALATGWSGRASATYGGAI